MKIAIRGGHNYGVPGASGILDEVAEDRKVYAKVIEYLKKLGHEVLDVTPNKTSTSAEDLSFGVSKANRWGADYFCSIHFNAGGGRGTEVLYYNGSTKGKSKAEKIARKIAELGFINRGAKVDTRGLYELRNTKMPANIIEVCFVDSNVDAELYRKVGVSNIARAIAEGITGQTIKVDKPKYAINYCLEFQRWYNKVTQTKAPLKEDGIYGANTEKAIEIIAGYIKQGKKYPYCKEFQSWYNYHTETKAPLRVFGEYNEDTERALELIKKIIREF